MKTVCFILLFALSSFGFSQNNYIVKIDDGRRVLLKSDFTWEYIDMEGVKPTTIEAKIPEKNDSNNSNTCNIPENFEEPKLDYDVQNKLKRGRATIEYVKRKAAKDNDCLIHEVILIAVTEKIADGFYDFCINGKKVSYKRIGNTITKRKNLFAKKS